MKKSSFQYGMEISIEDEIFIPAPSLASETEGLGLKFSIENENFKPRMKISSENEHFVVNASALYRGQNPQNREKRVSGSKNSHFLMPLKGRFESKNPHFSTGLHKENGDFLTQIALFWGIGKWEFFDPETLGILRQNLVI